MVRSTLTAQPASLCPRCCRLSSLPRSLLAYVPAVQFAVQQCAPGPACCVQMPAALSDTFALVVRFSGQSLQNQRRRSR
jgi:hypothetical protein